VAHSCPQLKTTQVDRRQQADIGMEIMKMGLDFVAKLNRLCNSHQIWPSNQAFWLFDRNHRRI